MGWRVGELPHNCGMLPVNQESSMQLLIPAEDFSDCIRRRSSCLAVLFGICLAFVAPGCGPTTPPASQTNGPAKPSSGELALAPAPKKLLPTTFGKVLRQAPMRRRSLYKALGPRRCGPPKRQPTSQSWPCSRRTRDTYNRRAAGIAMRNNMLPGMRLITAA